MHVGGGGGVLAQNVPGQAQSKTFKRGKTVFNNTPTIVEDHIKRINEHLVYACAELETETGEGGAACSPCQDCSIVCASSVQARAVRRDRVAQRLCIGIAVEDSTAVLAGGFACKVVRVSISGLFQRPGKSLHRATLHAVAVTSS